MRNRDARKEYSRYQATLMRAARRGEAGQAVETLREMAHAGAAPTAVQYTTAIVACGRAGKSEDMVRVLNDMRRHGVTPTHHTYGALITGFGRANDFHNAVVAYEKMQAVDGLEPTTEVINQLMHACTHTGHWSAALRHFGTLLDLGLRPDLITFNTALHACACGKQAVQAAQVFRAMGESGVAPDTVTYDTLIRALAHHPDRAPLDEVRRVPWPADARSRRHADSPPGAALAIAPQILASLGRPSRNAGSEPPLSTYVALSAAFAQRRDPGSALRVVEAAHRRGLTPPVRCYTQVLHALTRNGERGRAVGLLRHMQRSEMRLTPDARTSGASALAGERKWKQLSELVQEAKEEGAVDDALVCAALRPLLVHKRFADAREVVAARAVAGQGQGSPDRRLRKETRRAIQFLYDGPLRGAATEAEATHDRGSGSLAKLEDLLGRAHAAAGGRATQG